jgi:predicted lysophospholipase L1 biosynthesis ABC-type transport system permease subunit
VCVDATLFLVLLGLCLVVQELGALSMRKSTAAEHPGQEGMPWRKRLIIHGVWYAVVAALIIAWWFGSDFAGEMLSVVFVITALVAALTVLGWFLWSLRATLRLRHR